MDLHDAAAGFVALVDRVAAGEEVTITIAGHPVARLVPWTQTTGRVLGQLAGKVHVRDDFDAPLPDDLLRGFEGKQG